MPAAKKNEPAAGSASPPKGTKEAFARFAEDPSRESFRTLLVEHLGEARHLDFKERWPEGPDLSKQILGLGNTDGGVIIVGVREETSGDLTPVGLSKLTDKADIVNAVKKFLPSELLERVHAFDFSYDASEYPKIVGKSFQVLLVDSSEEHLPYLSLRAGKGIEDNVVYIRRDGLTERATHAEVQALLNRRIETRYSTAKELTLKSHFDQLRALYAEIPQFVSQAFLPNLAALASLASASGMFAAKRNKLYPGESVEAFVLRMIEAKKARIERELDL